MLEKKLLTAMCALLFFSKISLSEPATATEDLLLMDSDVILYYEASSVIIPYYNNPKHNSFEYSQRDDDLVNVLMSTQRELSKKFVYSLMVNSDNLQKHVHIYNGRYNKPLISINISTLEKFIWLKDLTARFDMSSAFWFVKFKNLTDLCKSPRQNYFNLAFDTNMLVKCGDDPIIREWYSLNEHETKTYDLATWDPVNHFKLKTNKPLYERRRSLEGKNFRAVETGLRKRRRAMGFKSASHYPMVIDALSSKLNFTVTIVHEKNLQITGIYNASLKQWTGLIGRLMRGDAELILSETAMTYQRQQYIDFTYPILVVHNNFVLKRPTTLALNWSAYFMVYSSEVWISAILLYVLTASVISFMFAMINKKYTCDILVHHFFQVWSAFLQQGSIGIPRAAPLKIAYFSIIMLGTIIYLIYSACLISYLTLATPILPFNNLEEFANEGSYKLLMVKDSAETEYFMEDSKDPIKTKLNMLKVDPEQQPETVTEGVLKVCQNKFALYSLGDVRPQVFLQIPCNTISVDAGKISSFAIALQKNSPYRELFNYYLLKLQDSGVMQHMRVYDNVDHNEATENLYKPVDWPSLTILFILSLTMAMSLVILCIEIVVHRISVSRKHRKISTYSNRNVIIRKNPAIMNFHNNHLWAHSTV